MKHKGKNGKKICDTFASKGWSAIRYALSFKYQTSSLLDYALKKEKLLLQVRRSIDTGTLIDLIATGLPNFVIDREKLEKPEDLYAEIGKLEHLVYKKNSETKKVHQPTKTKLKRHLANFQLKAKANVSILQLNVGSEIKKTK